MYAQSVLAISLIIINICTMGGVLYISAPHTTEQRVERCNSMNDMTTHQQKYCSVIVGKYLQSKE